MQAVVMQDHWIVLQETQDSFLIYTDLSVLQDAWLLAI